MKNVPQAKGVHRRQFIRRWFSEGRNLGERTLSSFPRVLFCLATAGLWHGVAGAEPTGLPGELPPGPETRGWARPTIPLLPETVAGVEEPVRSLNGMWRYTSTPPAGFWRTEVDPGDWHKVPVPGNLAVLLGVEVMAAETAGDGWSWDPEKNVETAYKREIEIPESFENKRVLLRFDAAFNYARVWVNGRLLRTHRGGFTPFYVDATEAVEPGEKAWVTVGLTAESPSVDYSHVRGLVGDVSLVAMAQDFPSRLQVHTRFDEDYRDATMRIETGMVFNESREAEILLRLTDREGGAVDIGEPRILIEANNPDAAIERKVIRPRHWTAEDPYLYTLTAQVRIDGQTVQTVKRRFGFRDVEVRGNKFYVNGRQVKLRGVNWHQAHPHLGVAVAREHDLESLRLLRDANVNHIRASHWPQFQYVLDAADELGFYLMQENSVMMVGWRGRGEMLDDPRHRGAFVGQFAEMFELSRSHPSVIMWGTGNESNWGENIRETQRYAHEIDPDNRPTIFSWGHQAPADGYEVFSHHYPGLGETYSRDDVPVLFDEYAHVYTHSDPWIDHDPAFRDFYGNSLRYFWDNIYRADGGLGGGIWHARDKLFFREDAVWEGFLARWGLLDVWNRPKPEFYHVKAAYSPVRVRERELVPAVGRPEVTIENRFHHTNLNELIVYWESGDNRGRLTGPDIEPMEEGVLALPEGPWELGEQLALRFVKVDLDGRERVVERHNVSIGRAVADLGEPRGPAPELAEEEKSIVVSGENFELRFDRTNGRIREWSLAGEPVVVGGPHLNLGYDGGLPGGPRPDPESWRLDSLHAERTEDRVRVRTLGGYGETEVEFRMEIDGEGRMEISFILHEISGGYDAAGVAFDLAGTADRIDWLRRGLWTVYPDDHVGRNRGTAYREPPAGVEEAFGRRPEHPWAYDTKDFHLYGAEDSGGRGTRDFRASRHDFVHATVSVADGKAGLRAAGPGTGSAKATVNPDGTVRFDVNTEWSHPGFTGWGANPYQRRLHLASGYINRIDFSLVGGEPDSPVSYVSPPDYEAAALMRLELEGGRLSGSFEAGRRAYRGVVHAAETRLFLEAAHPDMILRVNGEKAGAGAAEAVLSETADSFTVEVEVVNPGTPVRRSYFLTLRRSDNLALDRTVRASGALAGHPAELLVDDDAGTMWSASNTGEWSGVDCDEWVEVDLETPVSIGRWKVYHDPEEEIYRTRDFRLEYRASGGDEPWKTADSVEGNREAITNRTLEEPIRARYVRLRVTRKAGEGAQWPAVRVRQLKLFAPD